MNNENADNNVLGSLQLTGDINDGCDKYVEQTKFFEDAVVREQVFQLRTLQTIVNTEFKKMKVLKEEIEEREKSRHRVRVMGVAGFFTTQFLVSYHAIFNVEWLGWDLVEPMTYTVSQASFIIGLIFIMRNRGANVEYSGM